MKKSLSVSSESSLPPPEDDVDNDVCSDELLGSQSRRWLTDILSGGIPQSGEVSPASGLFVDSNFPMGELAMQREVEWKRPKAHPKNTYLSREDLSVLRPVLCSPQHVARREVVLRGSLPPGSYIIIPSTAEPNQQGAFLLRVLTEQGNNATPARKPSTEDITPVTELSFPHQAALPSPQAIRQLFQKHSDKKGFCKPLHLYKLLTEAIQVGVLAGSEKYLALEQCKSLVVLMDSQGIAQLSWTEFQSLWDKIRKWTDIFLTYDKDKTQRLEYQEVMPSLKAAGIRVDELVMQLVGLRYTEPNMTISYPGFLYLLMKLESMIHKFQAYDVMGTGAVTISYRQWLHMTMYN